MPNAWEKLIRLFRREPDVAPAPITPAAPPDSLRTTPLPELAFSAEDTVHAAGASVAPRRLVIGLGQHVGRVRSHNEDVLLMFTGELAGLESMPSFGLFVVADGMGGHAVGERASGIAARTIARQVLEALLPSLLATPNNDADSERPVLQEMMEAAMSSANEAVFAGVPEGGGTTLTAALLMGEQVVLGHVGDSRAYLITDDSFEQLTRDHSLVQRLQELGQLSAAEAAIHPQRNVLYRAVGQGEGLEIDVETRRMPPGASLLLCSDGLWGLVPNERIESLVRQAPSLQAACEALVSAANAAGGPDNITALMVHSPL
ncbi:MAG: PP2C family serine/threonine-protein phosphatase [Anaerolineales bacterium]